MPGTVLLRVSDTGCGIPSEKHEAIFEPFVQLRRSLTQGGEGTGLGLSISRDLARGMGGELTVQSVEGEGATFTLVLPAGRSQGSAVRKQESGTAAAL
jgi:signal transduction histidine kinase